MKLSTIIAVSALCLTLAPLGARADEQSDQQACMSDAMSVCGQFIPDRDKVGACLYSNRARISVACRTVMQRYTPSAKTASR
jgi:hypothetical protein